MTPNDFNQHPIDRLYVEWANTLDSTGTDSTQARERLQDKQTLEVILDNMIDIIDVGAKADLIKKWVFYGKPFTPSDRVGKLHPESAIAKNARNNFDNHDTVRIFHAVLGLVTEASEMMEMLKAHLFEGQALDIDNLIEEAGDQCWYLALVAKACEFHTLDEFMMSNKAKLTARYGDKWTQDSALNRDTSNEMKKLNDSIAICPTCKHSSHETVCGMIDRAGEGLPDKRCGCTYSKTQTIRQAIESNVAFLAEQEGDIDDQQTRVG